MFDAEEEILWLKERVGKLEDKLDENYGDYSLYNRGDKLDGNGQAVGVSTKRVW